MTNLNLAGSELATLQEMVWGAIESLPTPSLVGLPVPNRLDLDLS